MFVVEKNTASEWFSALRDQIINAFVGLEQSHQHQTHPLSADGFQ